MTKLKEWRLAQKIQASGRRGVIVGICIAVLILVLVVVVIVKYQWLKRLLGRDYIDEFDDEYYLDDDDLDENGCAYTSEKDFAE